MNRCETCKHWGRLDSDRPYKGLFLDGSRRCLMLEREVEQDGEPCAGDALLGTSADFGCVLWEAKE